jgi:putative PEP-CTERM system TPR-repeat lipoprotein
VAQIEAATKQTSEARKTLLDALRIQPDLLEAKSMLGGLEIQAARYDEALKLARQIQQENSDSPAGPMLEGDIALTRKQYDSALAAYERAHKLAPSGAALIRQHQALVGMQRSEDGEKRLASWLSSHPQDGRTRLYLAERLNSRGQYKQASDHYLILNQQNPGNLVVINNLAWALQGLNDPRALGYAEQAYKLRPDDPAVMDTLGWLLIQKGQAERGTKMLQQALSKAPDAAEIQYHLALAYNKRGDHIKARRELERLLASGLAFPREQEAHALLKQLQGNGQ